MFLGHRRTFMMFVVCFAALSLAARGAALEPPQDGPDQSADAWQSRAVYQQAIDAFDQIERSRAYADALAQYESALAIDPEIAHQSAKNLYRGSFLAQDGADIYDARKALTRFYSDLTFARPGEGGLTVLATIDDEGELLNLWLNDIAVSADLIARDGQSWLVTSEGGDELITLELHLEPTSFLTALLAPDRERPHVRIGITMEDVPEALAAHLGLDSEAVIMIAGVTEGMPAARAGLRRFDIVICIDGDKDVTQDRVREVVQSKKPGETITLHIIRGGEESDIEITVETDETLGDDLTVSNAALNPLLAWQRGRILDDAWTLIQPSERSFVSGAWRSPQQRLLTRHWYNAFVQTPPQRSVTLQVTPRIVNKQVVLDVRPRSAFTYSEIDGTIDYTEIDETIDPKDQLRQEIAQLKAQLERLEKLLDELAELAADEND